MRDRVENAFGIVLRARLDQPVGLLSPGDLHGAVEDDPVEPVFIHIAQEVGCGNRCAFGFQRDEDIAHRGFKHDLDGLVRRVDIGGRCGFPLRICSGGKQKGGTSQERGDSEGESVEHRSCCRKRPDSVQRLTEFR